MSVLWLFGMRDSTTSQNEKASRLDPTIAPAVPTVSRSQTNSGSSLSVLTTANGTRSANCDGPPSQMPSAASHVLLRYSQRSR
jgi:hypothetical protein